MLLRSRDGGVSRLGARCLVWSSVSAICDSSQASIHIGCFKASMHVLYPERPLFSLTKDIRIKLILYYQTLYTTEVANNTEFKERSFFLNVLLFFPLPPKKVQYKTIV